MKQLLCIILLFFSLSFTVFAADPINDLYSSLPDDLTDAFPENFEDELKSDGASAVSRLDANYFLSFISSAMKASLSDSVSEVYALIFIIVISSVMLAFSDGIPYKPITAAATFAVIGCLTQIIKPLSEQMGEQIQGIGSVMKLSLPIMTAVSGASGQPSAAAVNAVWLNTALTLTEQLTESILSPLISVCIALAIASSLMRMSGNNSLSGAVGTVKNTFVFLLTLIVSVFTAVMSFQNVIAKGSDTVLLRSVKFVSGSAIPVIGGALSEAAGAYLSSISLVKSSLGTLCAVCITVSVLPYVIRLFTLRLALSLCAFLSDIMGGAVSAEIREFSSILDLLTAISVLSSVTFIIAVGVFASTLPV